VLRSAGAKFAVGIRSLAADCCGWLVSAHPANTRAPIVRTSAEKLRIFAVMLVSIEMCGTGWSITLSIIEIEHDVVYSLTAEVKSMSSTTVTMPEFQINSIAIWTASSLKALVSSVSSRDGTSYRSSRRSKRIEPSVSKLDAV
jgi:hypothetical protein